VAVALENGNLAIVPLNACPQPQGYYTALAHEGGATDVAFSPTGDWLVTGGRDGMMKIWSQDGQWLADLGVGAAVEAVAVSDDAGYIASVDADGRLILWGIP
jgi:WD40 repeat protein